MKSQKGEDNKIGHCNVFHNEDKYISLQNDDNRVVKQALQNFFFIILYLHNQLPSLSFRQTFSALSADDSVDIKSTLESHKVDSPTSQIHLKLQSRP